VLIGTRGCNADAEYISISFVQIDCISPPCKGVIDNDRIETYITATMILYKRNQVEEAIPRVFEASSAEPSSTLRTRIKRLLDADRGLGRNPRAKDPVLTCYAFYSRESPGRGADVLFSDYEAFALMVGLQMLNHNWPQSFVVETLRRCRPDLETRHTKILKLDPRKLFDEKQIMANAQAGTPAYGTTSPVFLLIWSDNRHAKDPAAVAPSAGIFDDEIKAFQVMREKAGRSTTWLELTRSAHSLRDELSETEPKQRGRS
jgi:hypothetical protein